MTSSGGERGSEAGNGEHHTNGWGVDGAAPGPSSSEQLWIGDPGHGGGRHRIHRAELVRVMSECMRGLGYGKAAAALEQEAGVGPTVTAVSPAGASAVSADATAAVTQAIGSGDWGRARALLPKLHFKDAESQVKAELVLLREEFLHLLLQGGNKVMEAVTLLRDVITPTACKVGGEEGRSLVSSLSLLLLCPRPDDVCRVLGRQPHEAHTHKAAQEVLAALGPAAASASAPKATPRLLTLLAQALDRQAESCVLHNPVIGRCPDALSHDHKCHHTHVLPEVCVSVLEGHTDEVWALAWSGDGSLLASGSKDNTLLLWDLSALMRGVQQGKAPSPVKIAHAARGLSFAPHLLCWSPVERCHELLVSGNDTTIIQRLAPPHPDHHAEHGGEANGVNHEGEGEGWRFVKTYQAHTAAVTGVAWLPGGQRFVSGSQDKRVLLWEAASGQLLASHTIASGSPRRITALAATASGRVLVLCGETRIRILHVYKDGEGVGGTKGAGSRGAALSIVRNDKGKEANSAVGPRGLSADGSLRRRQAWASDEDDDEEEEKDEEEEEEEHEASQDGEEDDDEEDEDEDEEEGEEEGSGDRQAMAMGPSPPPENAGHEATRGAGVLGAQAWRLEEKGDMALPPPPPPPTGRPRAGDGDPIIVTSLSAAGDVALVDLFGGPMVCVDVEGNTPVGPSLCGRRQRRYVLHGRMGGHAHAFVAAGTEDARVLIWHRESGRVVMTLRGHGAMVSDVAWCPTHAQLLATASDDHTIRLWLSRESLGEAAGGSTAPRPNATNGHRQSSMLAAGE